MTTRTRKTTKKPNVYRVGDSFILGADPWCHDLGDGYREQCDGCGGCQDTRVTIVHVQPATPRRVRRHKDASGKAYAITSAAQPESYELDAEIVLDGATLDYYRKGPITRAKMKSRAQANADAKSKTTIKRAKTARKAA